MLAGLLAVLGRVWRGAWRPLYPLAPQPKWYHYVEYWLRRPRDYIVGAMVFVIPLAIGYLLFEVGSIHPALLLVQLSIWSIAVVVAYCQGRDADAGPGA